MTKHIKKSWQLFSQGVALIKTNPRLIIFPMISALILAAMMAAILSPIIKRLDQHPELIQGWGIREYALFIIGVLLFFFVYNLIITYFSACLIGQTLSYSNKRPDTLQASAYAALKHSWILFLWTLMNTTVGIVVRAAENWSDNWPNYRLTNTLLAGLPWQVAIYFILPILMSEKINPILALIRSSHTIRNQWGKVNKVNIRILYWITLARILALAPLLAGLLISGTNAIITGSILSILLWLVLAALQTSVHLVLATLLYLYAIDMKSTLHLNEEACKTAFVDQT